MNPDFVFDAQYETFQDTVIQASYTRPILVDIWADWCAPCLVLAPILNTVLQEYAGDIALAKVDVDDGENMKIAGRYKVRGFPTVLLFQQGEEKARFSGARAKTEILAFLKSHLPG